MSDSKTFGLTAKFNGKRLQQAREIAGYTREALAEKLNQLPAYIKLLETTSGQPEAEFIEDLSMLVAFPIAFFFQPAPPEFFNADSSFWLHYGKLDND